MSETIGARIDFTQGADDSRQAMIALANAIAGLSDKGRWPARTEAGRPDSEQRENKNATDEAGAHSRRQLRSRSRSCSAWQASQTPSVAHVAPRVARQHLWAHRIDRCHHISVCRVGCPAWSRWVAGGAVAGFHRLHHRARERAHRGGAGGACARGGGGAQPTSISSGLDTAIRTGGDLSTADRTISPWPTRARLNLMAQQRDNWSRSPTRA